jgi:hypothetical protein
MTGRRKAVKYEAPAIVDRQGVEGLMIDFIKTSDQAADR